MTLVHAMMVLKVDCLEGALGEMVAVENLVSSENSFGKVSCVHFDDAALDCHQNVLYNSSVARV